MYCYTGKILEVNLDGGSITVNNLSVNVAKNFLGGLGYNVWALYNEVPTSVDPFDSGNLVLFTPGALTGTNAPTSARIEVSTKSPLTGIIGTGNAGGYWGSKLKHAGFDSVKIRGRSNQPVYLLIDDDKVELKEASWLWGKNAWETTYHLKDKHGSSYSVMAIGQAGENLVRFAAPVFDKQHMPGRCHAGAILGDKKLKAIVVNGTKDLSVRRPVKFLEAVEDAENRIKSFKGWQARVEAGSMGCYGVGRAGVDYEVLAAEQLKRGPLGSYCPCMMEPLYGCNLVTEIKEGPYKETQVVCAGLTLYSGTAEQLHISLPAAFKLNEVCQKYGMDMFGPIYFAYRLYQNGVITEEDTGNLKLELGNEEALFKLIQMIALREGIGDTLAEGSIRAAKIIGNNAERYVRVVKGLEPMYIDPVNLLRDKMFTNLSILTNPRGGDDLKGTHGLSNYPGLPCWAERLGWREEEYLPWLLDWLDMPEKVKDEIFGVPPRLDHLDDAYMTKWYGDLTSVYNSFGLCMFACSVVEALGPNLISSLYTSGTGFDIDPIELMKAGERIFNLMRAYSIRAGLTSDQDSWPEHLYRDSSKIEAGKVDGFSKSEVESALTRYYSYRGWNRTTGIPERDKLIELDLEDVAEELS